MPTMGKPALRKTDAPDLTGTSADWSAVGLADEEDFLLGLSAFLLVI